MESQVGFVAMWNQQRSRCRSSPRAARFGVLALIVTLLSGCFAGSKIQPVESIDLCEVSGPEFKNLESRLHREVTSGDKASRLVSKIAWNATHTFEVTNLADVDDYPRQVEEFKKHFPGDNPALQPYTDGLLVFHHQVCEKPNENSNQWSLFIRADKWHRIDEFGIVLTYVDRNFAARNEPLNHRRYLIATDSFSTPAGHHRMPVTMALDSLMNDRGYSAQRLIDEILAAGFVGSPAMLTDIQIGTRERTVLAQEFTFPDPLGITDPTVNGEFVYFRFGGFFQPDFKWRFVVIEAPDSGEIVMIE